MEMKLVGNADSNSEGSDRFLSLVVSIPGINEGIMVHPNGYDPQVRRIIHCTSKGPMYSISMKRVSRTVRDLPKPETPAITRSAVELSLFSSFLRGKCNGCLAFFDDRK